MPEPVQRHHVLAPFLARTEQRTQTQYGVAMEILPYRGYLNLRGDARESGFAEAVREVLGQPLPGRRQHVHRGRVPGVLAGAGRVAGHDGPGRAKRRWPSAPGAMPLQVSACALTDLTGGQICIRLQGRDARNALAKGCTLDLHPRVFLPGQCAQTVLGKASMLIALSVAGAGSSGRGDTEEGKHGGPANGAGVFDIIVRRTFAEYAAKWLYRSAQEYGIRLMGQGPGHAGER